MSGLDDYTPSATLSTEGANQTITGTATDRAGNVATFSIKGINLDKTGPIVRGAPNRLRLWPPNGKFLPVTVKGRIKDPISGVDPTTPRFEVIDEYGQVQPAGAITLNDDRTYSFVINLQSSRLGTDKDGRLYTILVSAADLAGNPTTHTMRVVVPHNQ